MSLKLACEIVAVFGALFFATAFAVSWKDCGEFTTSLANILFTSVLLGERHRRKLGENMGDTTK